MGTTNRVYHGIVLETLEELSAIVAPEEILRTMATKLGNALQADRCAFMSVGSNLESIKIITTYEDSRFRNFTLDARKYPELTDAMSQPCTCRIYNSCDTPCLRPIVEAGNLAPDLSIMVLPVAKDDDSDRQFFLRASRRGRTFENSEIDFCTELARVSRNLVRRTLDYRRMESRVRQAMRTRRKALKSNERKTQLLQFISHELKNPICILNGYLDYLAMPEVGSLNDEQQEVLKESRQVCGHVLDALHSLLYYSKFSDGRLTYNFRRESLATVVNQLLSWVTLEADRKKIRISGNIPQKLTKIMMDMDKISFALSNLVCNALNYTPAGGEIIISIHQRQALRRGVRQRYQILRVADTGPGVEPERIASLFKPTGRIGRPGESGHELGLVITRRIVNRHGGKIRLDPAYTRGACFEIALPVRTDE
jgi:signal transduction histidine kinase